MRRATLSSVLLASLGLLPTVAPAEPPSVSPDTSAAEKPAAEKSQGEKSVSTEERWDVAGRPNARTEDIVERWCEINGKRVRYANFPIPGYAPCGGLSVQRTCDPTGKRFIGGAGAPYSYLDCGRGPRMQIWTDQSGVQATEASRDTFTDEQVASDFAALEKRKKSLDAMLDGRTGRKLPPTRQQGRDSGLLNLLKRFGEGGEVESVLESIGEHNDELKQLLDGLAKDGN